MKLAIIIVNYKTPQLVIDCLNSFQEELDRSNSCIIVIDNCSHDGSVETLKNWIAAQDDQKIIQLIEATTNAGFSAGNNIGIRAADANYYLLLNSDTLVRSEAIAKLVETAENHSEAGIISPRLEWADGTPQQSCFRFLSPISELINVAQTGPITNILKRFDVPLPVSDTIVNPQWTSFAGVLIRREVINDVGLMDDGFFMFFEDVEYCRRARRAGWDIIHNPKARVVHLRGGSSPVKQRIIERKRLPRYYYAARTRYFFLAYGWLGLTLANLLWSLGRSVSKFREIVERRAAAVPDKQWLDIWTNWLRPGTPWRQPQDE